MTSQPRHISEARLAQIRSRRKAGEVSLAIENLYLTPYEKSLLDQFDADRLTPAERRKRVRAYGRSLLLRHAAE